MTTRRALLGTAATLTACAMVPERLPGAEAPAAVEAATGKPNSVFNGVRIGCITYSCRGGIISAEDTLKALVQDGLREVSLMGGPIQLPAHAAGAAPAAGARGGEPPRRLPRRPDRAEDRTPVSVLRKMSRLTRLVTACIALSAVSCALAGDWPQWNGPNRDGKSADTGLLTQWPVAGPKLAWRATGVGKGYSTVAVLGDRLYTMGDRHNAGWVMGVSADGGTILWSTKVGAPGSPSQPGYDYPGPRCTPAVDGNLVVALDPWGTLICVSAADGKEQWRKNLVKDFGGTPPTWGYSESPLVDGDQVVVTPGGPKGALLALNKRTSDLIWQSKDFTDPAHYSSIIAADIEGTRQYVQLTAASLVGISAKDGSVLWKVPRRGTTAVIPTPIVTGNEIYVTSGYNVGCNRFRVTKAGGRFSAVQLYANRVMVNQHGGVVQVGEYVYGYCDGNGLTCQRAKTGEAVWAESRRIKKASVSYADGRLYCREENTGTMILVDATPGGYAEKGRFAQPSRTRENAWTHPVIAHGKLYVRDQDLLLCYDVRAAK
jgi:outer membrane protein assembly factor BamB